jgi:hypothetical protein
MELLELRELRELRDLEYWMPKKLRVLVVSSRLFTWS